MASGAGDVDRLRDAIEAHERFVAEHGRRSASDFLAEHMDLRDLLEPLLGPVRTAAEPSAGSARVLGDFRLLGELGRGGMGIVYDAEQISLGRRVAVKVLPDRLALDPDRRARFARESRLTASLDHPGIARVISAGIDDDLIWFAMERVDGAPLDRVLIRTAATQVASMTGGLLESAVGEVAGQHGVVGARPEVATDEPAPDDIRSESTVWRTGHVETVVRIGIQIAAALHHAHQHGVAHRDVKPANIVLRRDGSAVLTDFGLARELSAPSLTLTGDFMGTPSYSAPEQLSGDRTAVDHRADVFALGVTLYELLTHRRPFEASSGDEVRVRILTVEPPQPRRLNPRIPNNLSSVLQKALEKDPNRRYQTAAAMADDLRAVLEGRPVRAQPTRAHTRIWRWCRRNPWAATTLTLLLGGVLLLLAIQARLARANDEKTIVAGVALARAGDFHGALAQLMPLERRFRDAATVAALDELFRRYPCLASSLLVSEPDERVTMAQFSSDRQRLLTRHEGPREAGTMWHLRLWTVPTPEAPIPQVLWSGACAGSPSAVLLDRGLTVAWAIEGDKCVFVGGPGRDPSPVRFEFKESVGKLYPASKPGCFGVRFQSRIQLRDADGQVDGEWSLPPEGAGSGLTILGDVLVWYQSTDSGWEIASSSPDASTIPADIGGGFGQPLLHLDPDDQNRLVVTTDRFITAWRCVDGKLEPEGRRENPLPSGLSHSLLSHKALGLEENEEQHLLARLGELPLRQSNLVSARLFEAGAGRSREPYIVAVEAQALRIWGMPEPRVLDSQGGGLEPARFEPATRGPKATTARVWCAGEKTLAAWSFDVEGVGSRVVVEMPPEIKAVAKGMKPSFSGIAFDPGRAILASARADIGKHNSSGWVFVLPTDGLLGPAVPPSTCSSEPNDLALSPDYRHLAVAGTNGGADLWTYDSERRELAPDPVVLPKLAGGAPRLSCVRFLDKRFLLASAGARFSRGEILRWDLDYLDAPPIPITPPEIRQALRCLAISDDKQLVATGGDDRVVRVMRVVLRDGKPTLEQVWHKPHNAPVFAVAFARRNGALILASADNHGVIRLWDAETGEERGIVREASESHYEMILSLDFTLDGRHLAASQRSGRGLLWNMDRPGECLKGNRDCAHQMQLWPNPDSVRGR